MRTRNASIYRAACAFTGLVAWLAAVPAGAAVTTVYKCFDGKLNVVYTDQPCRGEELNIEGGTADAAAVAALAREREALSRSAEQRMLDNRRATLDRDLADRYAVVGPPPLDYGSQLYYPGGGGYYPGYADRRPRQDRARPVPRRDRAGVVPAPPGNLIRR